MNEDDRNKTITDWRHQWEENVARDEFTGDRVISSMVRDLEVDHIPTHDYTLGDYYHRKTGKTLDQREKTHGKYEDNCTVTQRLEDVIRTFSKRGAENRLTDLDKETIHMILHKLARACNGNTDFADHWHDIAGYATLRERKCGKVL